MEHTVNGELKLMLKNLLELMLGAMYVLSVALSAQLLFHLIVDSHVDVTMLLLTISTLLSVPLLALLTGTRI